MKEHLKIILDSINVGRQFHSASQLTPDFWKEKKRKKCAKIFPAFI
jgi:hypothetical protein